MSADIDWSNIHATDVEGEDIPGDNQTEELPFIPSPEDVRLGDNYFDPPEIDDEPTPVYDQPDERFVKATGRKRGAVGYEKKVTSLLQTLTQVMVNSENTIPDSAALVMYGPKVATAWGDLAANDANIARAIDWLTEGTENPYLSAIVATAPLALQILRNHEPAAELSDRKGIKIPFTGKRYKPKFTIKLGKLRNVTHDPDTLVSHVFGNPNIQAAMAKNGIDVSATLTRRQARRAAKAAR